MTGTNDKLFSAAMCYNKNNLPISLCNLLHLSIELGNKEWPNRNAAAEKASKMLGFTSAL